MGSVWISKIIVRQGYFLTFRLELVSADETYRKPVSGCFSRCKTGCIDPIYGNKTDARDPARISG